MRRVETIALLVALAFYLWFIHYFGLAQLVGYVRLAGWGLALTVSLEALARIANTLGWRVTIERLPQNLRLRELFAARIAGEAVDYTTPSAQLGGQFVMALMVRRKLAMAQGLATVIAAALAEMVGQIGFIALALLFSIGKLAPLHSLLWPAAGGLALAIGLALGFFLFQKKRPFTLTVQAVGKLFSGRAGSDEIRRSAGDADQALADLYARHRVRLAVSCVCYLCAWALGPVEIYLLLYLLHQHATVRVALLTEALGLLIERATFLIPAKLVSQEGGKALVMAMLGYPALVGFAVGFLRRIKELIWVMLGLGSLGAHRMLVERDEDKIEREPRVEEQVLLGAPEAQEE